VERPLAIKVILKTMKEYILERNLLSAATVRNVLVKQEIYSDTRELTPERNLSNVHSVENAIVKHVISEFIRLISIQGGSVFIFTTSLRTCLPPCPALPQKLQKKLRTVQRTPLVMARQPQIASVGRSLDAAPVAGNVLVREILGSMKECILERSLLSADIATSGLVKEETYSGTRDLTRVRNLLNASNVKNALAMHVISGSIK